MWLVENLAKILIINLILYFCLKKYFGFVRTWLYCLIVAAGIFVGYFLDMLAFAERDYQLYIAMGIAFAFLVAACVYGWLFEKG